MPVPRTRMPRTRMLGSGLLAGAVALSLSLAGCSSDDSEPAPSATVTEQTTAPQTPAEQSTSAAPNSTARPQTSARQTAGSSADAGDPKALSCRDFRALEDEGRAAAVAALGVKSNADQVATVAATACLGRLDDKVADVVSELVPTR
ncbi:hypothetical protein RD149_12270 [Gordonia westfalica]|uniref:DUF732 domain-containing protein n=1 Tax=Gordonia westfalica TaxID=158898 RepID=A0ABU2GSV1_9ACTN|nr:hypothetical protein [Gordonia westfalica]MDS1114542.1 hypothetical protein [Gordonia westfalica]